MTTKAPSENRIPFTYSRTTTLLVITAISVGLFLLTGTRLANYDTLYALVWGHQLWHGETPNYAAHLAPTPHPFSTLVGVLLTPITEISSHHVYGDLSAKIITSMTIVALAVIVWLVFLLGSHWVNRTCGIVAAAIVATRVPVLDFSARGFFDIGYVALILGALLIETRKRGNGVKPMVLLAIAGLWRPEAWVFAFFYLGWIIYKDRRGHPIISLGLIALSPICVWLISDWLVTGNFLYSFSDARHTGQELGRVNSLSEIPVAVPRRIGEILREPVLFGATVGVAASLLWLRNRAILIGAAFGLATAITVCGFTALGLPITTRYLLLPAVILSIFCGAGLTGWSQLVSTHRYRKVWIGASLIATTMLFLWIPWQATHIMNLRRALAKQSHIQNDLRSAFQTRSTFCTPYMTPNRRPVPLIALWLSIKPENILDAQSRVPKTGTYFVPTNQKVSHDYILDKRDANRQIPKPPKGFTRQRQNRSWQLWTNCPQNLKHIQ